MVCPSQKRACSALRGKPIKLLWCRSAAGARMGCGCLARCEMHYAVHEKTSSEQQPVVDFSMSLSRTSEVVQQAPATFFVFVQLHVQYIK